MLRAIFLLAAFVVAGVYAAEAQMNGLTLRSDFVRAVNLRREAQGYAMYALGARVPLTEGEYPEAVWENGALVVRLRHDWSLTFPAAAAEREAARLVSSTWRSLAEAYDGLAGQVQEARQSAVAYTRELQEYLETF